MKVGFLTVHLPQTCTHTSDPSSTTPLTSTFRKHTHTHTLGAAILESEYGRVRTAGMGAVLAWSQASHSSLQVLPRAVFFFSPSLRPLRLCPGGCPFCRRLTVLPASA